MFKIKTPHIRGQAESSVSRSMWLIIAGLVLMSLPLAVGLSIGAVAPFYLMAAVQLFYRVFKKRSVPRFVVLLTVALGILSIVINALVLRNISGYEWALVLFLFAFGMKLMEINGARDVYFVLVASMVMIGVVLLQFTSMASAVYLMASVMVWLALFRYFYTLKTRNSGVALAVAPASNLSVKGDKHKFSIKKILILRQTLQWVLLSLPMTFALFYSVPRLEPMGFLTMKPQSSIGLSDHVSLENISGLQKTGKTAFRVEFVQGFPQVDLYWRVLTLGKLHNESWSRLNKRQRLSLLTLDTETLRWQQWLDTHGLNTESDVQPLIYQVLMEPDEHTWLPSLQTPKAVAGNIVIKPDWTVERQSAKDKGRFRYSLAQYDGFASNVDFTQRDLQPYLAMPQGDNPQLRSLGKMLLMQYGHNGDSTQQKVRRIEALFRQAELTYTLSPARVPAQDKLDAFYFDTRQGYCEYFASATAFLLRASGVPSRLVAGFVGGEWNEVGQYMEVKQDNAHAWVEYWQNGAGWIRLDPTTWASFVEIGSETGQGMAQSLSPATAMRRQVGGFNLAARLAAANYQWYRWVVKYDKNQQKGLWQKISKKMTSMHWRSLLKNVLRWIVAILAAIVLWRLLQRYYRANKADREHQWQLFEHYYTKQGICREKSQTAMAYGALIQQRLRKHESDNQNEAVIYVRRFVELYSALTYNPLLLSGSKNGNKTLNTLVHYRKKACVKNHERN